MNLSVDAVDGRGEVPTVLTYSVVGDKVSKVGGDYTFDGVVVSIFKKLSGQQRFVVEDDRGVLHIFSAKNLKYQNQDARQET